MSYGPKNDDGNYPGQDASERNAHLFVEQARLTPAQIEAARTEETRRARSAKQVELIVTAVNALAELVAMGEGAFPRSEWLRINVSEMQVRGVYVDLFNRDLKARGL